MENTGSFGAAIGGADPLQAAMAARQTGQAGATQQLSPAAAGFDPTSAPAPTSTGAPQAQPQAPQGQPALPFDSNEAKMIIQSLSKRLEAQSKFMLGGQ